MQKLIAFTVQVVVEAFISQHIFNMSIHNKVQLSFFPLPELSMKNWFSQSFFFFQTFVIIGHLKTLQIYPQWYVLVVLEVSSRVGIRTVLLLFSALGCAQHITLQLGRVRSHPVTWQHPGRTCTCKGEVQGGSWNSCLCSCCQLGELRIMACFAEPRAIRIGLFLLIVFSYYIYWIIFQCARTCFTLQMHILFVSSGLLTFSLFNCDWD